VDEEAFHSTNNLVKKEYDYPKQRPSFYFTGELHKYTESSRFWRENKKKKQRKRGKAFF
jgi:hypothetical protein